MCCVIAYFVAYNVCCLYNASSARSRQETNIVGYVEANRDGHLKDQPPGDGTPGPGDDQSRVVDGEKAKAGEGGVSPSGVVMEDMRPSATGSKLTWARKQEQSWSAGGLREAEALTPGELDKVKRFEKQRLVSRSTLVSPKGRTMAFGASL